MLKSLLTSSFLFAAFVPGALAANLQASSQTQRVTAYQGMALITRRVELPSLTSGNHEIQIADLPQGMIADSLSISGEGNAKIKIHHLQLKPLSHKAEDPALQALRQQIEALQYQLDAVENESELNEIHENLLETFQQQLEKLNDNKTQSLRVKEWQDVMNFALQQSKQILSSQQSTEIRKEKLDQQLAELNESLKELEESLGKRQELNLFVSVEQAGKASLLLSYLIPNVAWQPAYEARLDPQQQKLKMVYLGDLSQRSGESWKNVQLTLSTATPVLNQRPPQPQSWVIGGQRPYNQPASGAVARQSNEDISRAPVDERERRDINYAQSEVQQTGISVRFQLPEAQNVPSGSQPRRLAMASREFNVTSAYRIVPRQSPLAFLEVQLKNDSGLPFLPGSMRSYLGEEFTGSQSLELIRPGQVARLNFGVDQDIKVIWKELARKHRNTGVLGDQQEIVVDYEAEITNFKPLPVDLRIQEPLPVAADDKIKIEQIQAEPAPSQTSKENRLQTWQIKAQPWEKKTIRLTYKITAPKEMFLNF